MRVSLCCRGCARAVLLRTASAPRCRCRVCFCPCHGLRAPKFTYFFLTRLLRRLQVRHSRVGGRVAVSRRVVSGRPCGALHAGSGFVTAGLPVLKWSCLLLSCGMWRGSRIARSACACCVRQGLRVRTSALGVRLRGNYVRLRGDCRRMRVESRSQLVARPEISSEVPQRYSDQQEAEMHGSRAIGAGFPISI